MSRSSDVHGPQTDSVWPAMAAVFALVICFTFSDDIVEFGLDVTGHRFSGAGPWLVLATDCLLVAATAALKWRIEQAPRQVFVRQLIGSRWALGAAIVVVTHLLSISTATHRANLGVVQSIWLSMLFSLLFVAAMALLLTSALGEKSIWRSWVLPMIVGTAVVQVASALWYPVIDVEKGCANDISSTYFSDMTNIIAIVLLTVGVELAYVRRTAGTTDPGRRVAPVFTVLWLCVGLALAFTMLVKADLGPHCGLAAVWHEYIAFVVTAQALSIGLTTVLWLLVTDQPTVE